MTESPSTHIDSSSSPSIDAIKQLVVDGYHRLCDEYPDQRPLGCIPFLGKHYAASEPGILMLGINPGGRGHREVDLELHDWNWLLEGPPELKIRYWNNARRLFSTTVDLRSAMETATFSFCCPYRTARWNGLERGRRQSLIRNSKPVMARMLADCQPRLIIVAGIAGLQGLGDIASPVLELGAVIDHGGDGKGTYTWKALRAHHEGRQLTVAQIPHLSRANSHARLAECGTWLTTLVAHS
jgi:hypothetical protein